MVMIHKKHSMGLYKSIGERIAKFRKEQKMSQEQLAQKVGVKQQVIANYEIARRRIPISFLLELAEVLLVDIEDLLGLEKTEIKRGPIPKLRRRLEVIQKLPSEKQKLACDVLDSIIKSS
jgi:transcriptional regulator with XRE-family HTH domain